MYKIDTQMLDTPAIPCPGMGSGEQGPHLSLSQLLLPHPPKSSRVSEQASQQVSGRFRKSPACV